MIFETSFSILNFLSSFFQFLIFQKSHFWIFFNFWLKHPQITRVVQKTVKIINLPYYLPHFIKKNLLFDVDFFSRTFDMESPTSKCPSKVKKNLVLGKVQNGVKCIFPTWKYTL